MLTDRPMLSGGGRIVDRAEEWQAAGKVAPAAAGR